ncbi:hypothetical protein BJV82DRAFT_671318 [Fennellomyces sp. T-0311]|nr:hypothetical protein BJV82DRAFT_671318 [Fennellomyces sp. T-0311]
MMDYMIVDNEDNAVITEGSTEPVDEYYDHQQMDMGNWNSIDSPPNNSIDCDNDSNPDNNPSLDNGLVIDDSINFNLGNVPILVPILSNTTMPGTSSARLLNGTPPPGSTPSAPLADSEHNESNVDNDNEGDSIYDFWLTTAPWDPATDVSHDLFVLFKKSGAPLNLYEQTVKIFNSYTHGTLPPLLSAHRLRAVLRRRNPIQPKDFDVCPTKGCKLYKHGDNTMQCSNLKCKSPRKVLNTKSNLLASAKSMQYLSLKCQLAMLVTEPGTRELLRYRSQYVPSENVF